MSFLQHLFHLPSQTAVCHPLQKELSPCVLFLEEPKLQTFLLLLETPDKDT